MKVSEELHRIISAFIKVSWQDLPPVFEKGEMLVHILRNGRIITQLHVVAYLLPVNQAVTLSPFIL
jgi:hypothetical protein